MAIVRKHLEGIRKEQARKRSKTPFLIQKKGHAWMPDPLLTFARGCTVSEKLTDQMGF